MLTQLSIMQQVNIESSLNFYLSNDIRLLFKRISLLVPDFLSDCNFKVIKLLYNMLPALNFTLSIYYPPYKQKCVMIEFTYNSFFFRLLQKLLYLPNALSDHFIIFAIYPQHYKDKLAGNLNMTFAYIAKLGLFIQKRKLLKTFSYLISRSF